MLACSSCGAENELGRVFCTSCGAKLDLSHMGAEEVVEMESVGWLSRHWPKFALGVTVLIVIMVFMAFWPKTAYVGDASGNRVGAQRVKNQISSLRNLGQVKRMTPPFSEKDVNAYLKLYKAGKLKLSSFSVSINNGSMHVRAVRSLKTFKVGSLNYVPKVSYDLYCVAVGNRLVVKSASLGHLPMIGPFKGIPMKKILVMLKTQKEWKHTANVTALKLEKGRAVVRFEKK
jgi:hypothetical protein